MEKRINVTRSSMPSLEEYVEKIKVLWDNRWLSNRGVIHKEFEEMLKERMKVDYLSLFANGHVALEVAIDAMQFPKGSEVITTPYTHCSTTHSIVRNGLIPVFCDVNDVDYTIDVSQIEKYINEKTVAIVATHVYGVLCDVEGIQKIAMFSCHATKVFHTIEGGITVFRDPSVHEKLESLINFGFNGPEHVQYISTNARMNEYEAAMGVCNLRHFDEEVAKRKIAADRYDERLSGIKGIHMIAPQKGVTRNYAYYSVFFDGYKYNRNEIQENLSKHNIFARKYFYPIIPELECYQSMFQGIEMPVAKHASETVLALPMYADLTVEDVDRICDIILK